MNDGIYLHTRYVDPRRGEVREREYADDGTVWVTVDGERSVRCRLDAAAVELWGRDEPWLPTVLEIGSWQIRPRADLQRFSA